MAWSERQVAMLRAMGLRTWQPAVPVDQPPLMAPTPVSAPTPSPSTSLSPSRTPASRSFRAPSLVLSEAPFEAPSEAPSPAQLSASAATPAPLPRTATLSLDWPALRDAVAACRACALCGSRQQTVFGVGPRQARWMVIGDAPGAQEDAQGEPFVGAAGQLLDNMLRALGLSRADDADPRQAAVYITNALKCRPPGNRNPAPDEMAHCEPFLQRQIELVQPQMILAMGRFAIQALLRSSEPVGKLRGRVHHYRDVPVVVTYHPAYLLRTASDKARAWDDLCLAASVVDGLAT